MTTTNDDISNICLSTKNLSRVGTFNPETQAGPYNQLYMNIGSNSLIGKKVALQKCNIWRSWANIRSDNNTFSFAYPTGTNTYTTINVVLQPNVNYETISELDNQLKTYFILNNMYLINNTTGEFLYWMSLVANPNKYGVSLIQTLVPTSLPSGYSTPSGFAGFPTVSRTMKFITDASKFNRLIGFAASSTFDGNTSATTFDSTICPSFNPVSSIRINLNIANNRLALNDDSTIIYTDSASGVDWGSKVEIEPNNLVYYNISNSSNTIILSFTDQDGMPLQMMDFNMDVLLLIKD